MSMHVGRAWQGHTIEDACKCPQAACGLVVFDATGRDAEDCPQHGWRSSMTLRQVHLEETCPARTSA